MHILATALTSHPNLETIILHYTDFDIPTCEVLVHILASNHNIKQLSVRDVTVPVPTFQYMIHKLSTLNTGIIALDIRGCNMADLSYFDLPENDARGVILNAVADAVAAQRTPVADHVNFDDDSMSYVSKHRIEL